MPAPAGPTTQSAKGKQERHPGGIARLSPRDAMTRVEPSDAIAQRRDGLKRFRLLADPMVA